MCAISGIWNMQHSVTTPTCSRWCCTNKKTDAISGLPFQISQKKRKEITFSVEQDFVVTHPKPAPVQIYDYYETGRSLILVNVKCGGGTGTAETLCALRETQNQPCCNQHSSQLHQYLNLGPGERLISLC